MFTPLTSSPHTFPSFYHSANTRLTLWGERGRGAEKNRKTECKWTGIGTKGTEEQQVPYAPAPSAGFVPALSVQQFKKQLPQIRPMGSENRPTCSKPLSLRLPSARESEEGDTVYAMCSSRRIVHEGPDVPPQCSLFSLIYAPGFARQHVYLHHIVFAYNFINVKAC